MPSPRLFRTTDAVDDLDALWDHIAQDNLPAADRLLDEIQNHLQLLLNYPEIGELQTMLADGTYRRSVYRNYVIFYRPIEQGIVVVRVLHGARDHESIL